MANLAIKGHKTRGSEVIALLEMLGGKNKYQVTAIRETYVHFIDGDTISFLQINQLLPEQFIVFTLEEFEEKFPYKVGDKVWLHYENLTIRVTETITCMHWCNKCNCVLYNVSTYCNLREYAFTPYKEETMEEKSNLLQQLKDYFDNTPREVIEKEWHEYDKYNEISPKVNEYLEYVNNIRQPKYPKTCAECCGVLKIPNDERYIDIDVPLDYNKLLSAFTKLLICRDAYWEIAGVQMGLGKPWEPDYTDKSYEQGSPIKYVIYYTGTHITKGQKCTPSYILTFPTEEMRDAFYENFKDLIENCKELL